MVIKMVALGIFGQKCYLGDTWNRLDFFIVMAGSVPTPSLRPRAKKTTGRQIPAGFQNAWGGGISQI